MAFKVTISGDIVLGKSIDSVTFNADTPPDNYYCMRNYTINSMQITGRIGAGEKTIGLYEWSLLPTSNPNCYREVEVEQTHAEKIVRSVNFSKAFVVGYSENFSKGEGVGHFSISIRQLCDVDVNINSEIQQNSESLQIATPPIEEAIQNVEIVTQSAPVFANVLKKRNVLPVTEKVKPVVEAKMMLNGKEYKCVNPTAREDRDPPPGELTGILGPTPNRNTRDMHAEISCMYKALKDGNKGGKAEIEVKGMEVCDWCQKDIKKMAQQLELDELTIKDSSGTYRFKGPTDFLNKSQGGKTWKMARL